MPRRKLIIENCLWKDVVTVEATAIPRVPVMGEVLLSELDMRSKVGLELSRRLVANTISPRYRSWIKSGLLGFLPAAAT